MHYHTVYYLSDKNLANTKNNIFSGREGMGRERAGSEREDKKCTHSLYIQETR